MKKLLESYSIFILFIFVVALIALLYYLKKISLENSLILLITSIFGYIGVYYTKKSYKRDSDEPKQEIILKKLNEFKEKYNDVRLVSTELPINFKSLLERRLNMAGYFHNYEYLREAAEKINEDEELKNVLMKTPDKIDKFSNSEIQNVVGGYDTIYNGINLYIKRIDDFQDEFLSIIRKSNMMCESLNPIRDEVKKLLHDFFILANNLRVNYLDLKNPEIAIFDRNRNKVQKVLLFNNGWILQVAEEFKTTLKIK